MTPKSHRNKLKVLHVTIRPAWKTCCISGGPLHGYLKEYSVLCVMIIILYKHFPKCGVTQGSVPGPLLFSYMGYVSQKTNYDYYEDDTLMLLLRLASCVSVLKRWMSHNVLFWIQINLRSYKFTVPNFRSRMFKNIHHQVLQAPNLGHLNKSLLNEAQENCEIFYYHFYSF